MTDVGKDETYDRKSQTINKSDYDAQKPDSCFHDYLSKSHLGWQTNWADFRSVNDSLSTIKLRDES